MLILEIFMFGLDGTQGQTLESVEMENLKQV